MTRMKTKAGIIVDNDLNDDKRVLREIDILAGAGYQIHVLCFGFDGKKYAALPGVYVTRIGMRKKVKDILFFFQNTIPLYEYLWKRRIGKFISDNDISILHVHDLYMSRTSYRGIKASGRKIPMILDLHENYPYAVQTYNWTKGILRSFFSRPRKWLRVEGEYLSYADRIIVLSREFGDELAAKYRFLRPENICAFPNVPDLSKPDSFITDKSKLRFEKKAPVIFYFGIVAERRGIFEALEAFRGLISDGIKAQFLIIGPTDKKDREKFFETISSEQLRDNVVYLPWINLEELELYLEESDICLAPFLKNPQHESGVANKIYDYMLGSKPIVASDCKPQKNLIEQYSCGLVYSNRDELRHCLSALLDDSTLRSTMGENGYKAVRDNFNTGIVKDNLLNCYAQALGK